MPAESRASDRFSVAPRTGTHEQYAVQVGELWSWLSPTLTHVEEPADVQSLRRLQYALHVASEHAYGLQPPAGAESAHAELADALASARDVTGEFAAGYDALLEDWRGALLRVRLARMRLATPARAESRAHYRGTGSRNRSPRSCSPWAERSPSWPVRPLEPGRSGVQGSWPYARRLAYRP